MDEKAARRLGRRLVKWYGGNARDLPWRRDPTPYSVWISEIMLQQTVVGTVAARYADWMKRFPDVRSLAESDEREVLAAWEGLGYYRRAIHAHRAARRMVRDHGGLVPSTRAELLALPGIGPYVASAVLSLAFGRDEVALDTNLIRVFMRLCCLPGRPGDAQVRREAMRRAQAALPAGRSAQYNQALMDFGSLICRPRSPRCGECFLRERCGAFVRGRQYDIPPPGRRKLQKVRAAVAVFARGGKVYLQQRPRTGLFARMWEFPGGKAAGGETPARALERECREELAVACRVGPKLVELTHCYTVFEVRLHAFLCEPPDALPLDATHQWVPVQELDAYPMPSANRRIVEALRAMPGRP
ncbi:MAG: A/G-specific adenine glycosylase [Candidatus Brocadiaceae bacterium]|nr:A/G-specific adenine glycosylase [Candidatus Brocadiaceae bacterium]